MFHSRTIALGLLFLVAVTLTLGCQSQAPPATTTSSSRSSHDEHSDEATDPKVSAALAKLSPQDQPIAKAQQFCAVMKKTRLGSMGTPIRFEIKGEPVFVCCSGCKAKALRNPDETLTTVAELKSASKTSHP